MTLEQRIQILRDKWKNSRDPADRHRIEIEARVLKQALETAPKYVPPEGTKDLTNLVKKYLM